MFSQGKCSTSSNSARTYCRVCHESALEKTDTQNGTVTSITAKSHCVCRSSDKSRCHSQGIFERVPSSVSIKLPHPLVTLETKLLKAVSRRWQTLAMLPGCKAGAPHDKDRGNSVQDFGTCILKEQLSHLNPSRISGWAQNLHLPDKSHVESCYTGMVVVG